MPRKTRRHHADRGNLVLSAGTPCHVHRRRVRGLVFIADCGRKFHCVDAATGKPVWTHDIKGDVWASPMVADGKVYLGTRSGDFYVFGASREKKVLMESSLVTPISATVTPRTACFTWPR